MTRSTPLVSVIVPTYNQEKYVGETLDSLLAQEYAALQIVVRDDGSADGTPAIVGQYARLHPDRITLLAGGENLGITGNCNRLLEACHGTYVALFAGDDVCLPGKIRAQVDWLEEDANRVLCHHDVETFDSDSGRRLYLYSSRHPLRGGSAAELVRYPAFCAGAAVMVRRDAIPSRGYETRIRYASDWLFFMETLLSRGVTNVGAGVVPGVFVRYRRHEGNVTRSADVYGLDEALLAYDLLEARAPSLRADIRIAKAERMATYGFRRMLGGDTGSGLSLVSASLMRSPTGLWRSLANALRYYSTARHDTGAES
jgi:glycosyltransferase involved in cell wall biosynthesis